jgi:hypothetical protein
MMLGYNFLYTEFLSPFAPSSVYSGGKEVEGDLRRFLRIRPVWAKAVKLLFKIVYFLFKVRVLRFQRRNLLRKQCDLFLEKIGYVLTETGSAGNSANFLSGVEGAHSNREVNQIARGSSNLIKAKGFSHPKSLSASYRKPKGGLDRRGRLRRRRSPSHASHFASSRSSRPEKLDPRFFSRALRLLR